MNDNGGTTSASPPAMGAARVLGVVACALAIGDALACRPRARDPALPAVVTAEHVALESVPRDALCFTEGAPSSGGSGGTARGIHVEAGGVRAFVANDRSSSAEIAFTYRGPSAFAAPLASGELRRQVGLKLRAQDTCNVVYVMWHIEPTQTVAVSVKRNAAESTHAGCGDRGYINLRSDVGARPPAVGEGVPHVLRAELDGTALRVTTDGIVVWHGQLPPAALEFDGPVGFRSDNGSFDVELRVPGGRDLRATCQRP